MKKVFLWCCAVIFLSGCATWQKQELPPDELSIEKRIGEGMIEAFSKQKYEEFIKHIPAGGRQLYSKDKFNLQTKTFLKDFDFYPIVPKPRLLDISK